MIRLEGQGVLVRDGVRLQLHPVAAFTSLGQALKMMKLWFMFSFDHPHLGEPGPLDVGVLLVTDAPNHPVVVHGVDDGGGVLGALGPLHGLQEERIVVASLLGEQLILFQT